MSQAHSGNFPPTPKNIMLTTMDGGETCDGIGLRSHLKREVVDDRLSTACAVAGVAIEGAQVNGSTYQDGANRTTGAVGVTFNPPVLMEKGVAFGASLTAGMELTGQILDVSGQYSQEISTVDLSLRFIS